MIGFEVELDRRVADAAGEKIAGDRNLAICASKTFKVVTDSRSAARADGRERETSYSNIELVTAPFDQALGLEPLLATVKNMAGFTARCYAIKGTTSLGDVLEAAGLPYELTADGVSTGVHPADDLIVKSGREYRVDDQGQDSLFAHYTVGFPVGLLADALDWVTSRTRPEAEDPEDAEFPITNARRAARAGRAAAVLFSRWAQAQHAVAAEADAKALAGFVALLYTQVAASIDHADPDSGGQIKNKTVAVSRVPLRAVALALPAAVQSFLQQQAWVDMLTEYEVGKTGAELVSFIAGQAEAAQEAVEDREDDGADADKEIVRLEEKITRYKQRLAGIHTDLTRTPAQAAAKVKQLRQRWLKALRRLGAAETELEQTKDIWSDYQGALQARDVWNQLVTALPADLASLNTARIAGKFSWSVIDQAIVPAFEGRVLADDLVTAGLGALFKPADPSADRAPDGGLARELATGLVSDLGGLDITVGEYLRSALLTPGQRPIWQTMLFGGMHELPGPDVFRAGGKACALIPLELRSFGKSEITWAELTAALNDMAGFSLKLMQAALT